MIKGLLRGQGLPEDRGAGGRTTDQADFEISTARFPGRSVITFQKRGGQATALEVTDRGAEIVMGLAAGVLVSELEEVGDVAPAATPPWPGGNIAASASQTVRPKSEATREEAVAFIRSLDLIDGADKQALLGALPR